MIDRRRFLQTMASSSMLALGAPVWGAASADDAALQSLLQKHSEAFLRRSPEEATGFGFDSGDEVALRSRLDDRSLEAMARDRQAVALARAQLKAIDRARLGESAKLDYDVADFVYETLGDLLGRYGYVDINLRPSPYVVSQMNGAYYWLPDFIGTRHPLLTSDDAESWYARLQAFAVALDQETARIRHDAAIGVVPPGFVIDRAVAQINRLRDAPVLESALIGPAVRRAREKGLVDLAPRAEKIFRAEIRPALTRQSAALLELRAGAVDVPGVWRLPQGEAYYAAAVRSNTSADTPPGELHQLGLAQCAEIIAQMDTLLRAQGLTGGSVGERIRALNRDPRFTVPNDDSGRARLIAAAEKQLKDIVPRLPRAFGNVNVRPIEVRRIPEAVEDGAPGAFYSEGGDGEPGTYSLNLKSPGEHALWRLPTLTHHEGIPGHHFQYSVLASVRDLPMFRKIVRFSAYTEGWALYAQQVAAELGVFESDPFGEIGHLQSQLFRAARIVVDTGIHHERWTRDQAIAWMVENAGEQAASTDREVVRYSVYPGQACSFKVGANRIVAAREAARTRMGARFDLREFHDLVLESGPVPLAVLESAVGRWSTS